MDMSQHPNSRDDPTSECRSFGGKVFSQPRKISRGILINSSAKYGPKNISEKAPVQSEVFLISSKTNPAEDVNRIETINATDTAKNSLPLVQEISPLSSMRSLHQKVPISDAVHGPTEAICIESSQRQYDRIIVGRNDSNAEATEKLSFATAQEVVLEDKSKKAETRGCETLRMKLWEILGTVCSPSKQKLSDYDLNVGDKNFNSPQKKNGEHNTAVKSKQNSDTIESDSEFPNETVSRLVNRTLSRNHASNKLKKNRARSTKSNHYKDIERKSIHFSKEGFSGRTSYGIRASSLNKNKSKNQDAATNACKTCSLDQGNLGEGQRVRNHGQVVPLGERSLSCGNEGGGDKEFDGRRKTEFNEPNGVALQRDSHQSSLIKMSNKLRNVIDSPKFQEKDAGYSFLKNTMNEKLHAKSPPFEMGTSTKRSSPDIMPAEIGTPTQSVSSDSPPKGKSGGPDCNPAGPIFNPKGIQYFKSWLASKSNCYQSNSKINSSDDAGENDDTPSVNPGPIVQEEPKDTMSKSSSQDSDSETPGEDSHLKGCREQDFQFPKIGNAEMLTHVLHLNKRQRNLHGAVKGCSKFHQHSELEKEDGLTGFREVALFPLALKKFKRKMNSVAEKRSAEILMSVAERINSQLQIAECQIQADVGKLTNHSKSKRKRLEMRYQELQEDLKTMHERFKKEVNEHIQHCMMTKEGLEAHQVELRAAAKKLRSSNRELLLQAEAAINAELSDAQRRITMIRTSARGKMLQLKNMVADCLQQGVSI